MPEYGTHYATHIFRSISTSIRRRHQRGDLDQLLGYPKYHRSSHMTTEHTILHKRAFSHIQPQIRSDPQGSIQNVTQ